MATAIKLTYIHPQKIAENVAQVSLGYNHSAYITTTGELYTFGTNGFGHLGDGSQDNKSTPVKIMDNIAKVILGKSHSSCITTTGELYTWGRNSDGQLGDGKDTNRYTPQKIMDNAAQVSLGSEHSACITTTGDLYFWGSDSYGQLCNADRKTRLTPTQINVGHKHDRTADYSMNEKGHWKVCSDCGQKVDYEEHIKDEGLVKEEATLTEAGIVSYKCSVCGAEMGEETVTLLIESIEISENCIIFICSSNIDDQPAEITVAFDDVSEELVDIIMKETDIYRIIDFVNAFTAADTDNIFTDAQLRAIEYVLSNDYDL